MKAVIFEKSRSAAALVLRDIEKPIPRNREVLVRIHASSLNALDYRSMQMGIGSPKSGIFGADIVGLVEAVGLGVTRFKPGDSVLGDISDCGSGGFSEYVSVVEDVLVLKPAGVPDEIAAAVPVAAVTALQAVRDKGAMQPGLRVLIYGTSGGVGTYAVQLAAFFGAQVTAVCSARNVAQAHSLGASEVIDYALEDVTASDRSFDRIIVINGNHLLSAYKRILAPHGICVMVGGSLRQIFKTMLFGPFLSIGSRKIRMLAAKSNVKDLEFVIGLVAAGKVRPVIDRQYSLEQTSEAMQYVSEGHAQGKVIITI
ncbi:Zn-dependent oxidoreductase, NADPH:quinone reductase [Sphaerochaeta pleomorpha str. Grapes]|uniref:Zn-dependent oxidoreductase, NADPH:quinone reductase n=1 Tax=Sphaerochaeta pleomorpha (strain ATCC BAA-1885 / DSM 22778 / Grapes) TaxID=158190 RepID=G8QSW7_SPHPG|nr:NAD(P)-dependent alcohol dehydrogenase [Sphaerochaeta pleomorpha]AEV30149.1 Zn-dependent oxidoreductase, NADPH:quinone reductase [Sphaerochaeta pleomorpha str. Grapes]